MMIVALSLALSGADSSAVARDKDHFIVSCALSKSEGTAADRKVRELNLLVNLAPDQKGNLKVVNTYDPSRIVPSGDFVGAFFDRSGETKFAAFTGSVKNPETRLLSLRLRAPSEYDAMLSDVRRQTGTFEGRCWMSNVAKAAEEFEKLKVKEVSQ